MCTFEIDHTWSGMDFCLSEFSVARELGFVPEAILDYLLKSDLIDSFNAHCDLSKHTKLTITESQIAYHHHSKVRKAI